MPLPDIFTISNLIFPPTITKTNFFRLIHMKKIFFSISVLAALAAIASGASKEQVLMTVNGHDVPKSEFEYLYHKNSSQQLQPQTIDEYVEMFIDYKLKVADAEAAGIDTTKAFRDDYIKFRNDLAEPYLKDSATLDSLLKVAYEHYSRNVRVSHIMLPLGKDDAENNTFEQRADSIRTAINNGTLAWNDAVSQFSIDRGTIQNHGLMGWIMPGLPAPFEEAAYNTPAGQISQPVNSGFGWHIIRVEANRPNPGEVEAQHILKLTQNKSEAEAAHAKAAIDSIYNVLTTTSADFAKVAETESDDTNSAKRGGSLGFFGPGRMVAEFDSVAFALNDGEISKPFATSYGYHIIRRVSHRDIKSYDEMKQQLEAQLSRTDAGMLPFERKIQQLTKKFDAKINDAAFAQIQQMIEANPNKLDSAYMAELAQSDITVYTIGDKAYPLKNIVPRSTIRPGYDPEWAVRALKTTTETCFKADLMECEREDLPNLNPEYRNLINEYRDGFLLFEISNRKVWDRASRDKEGLEAYFQSHRDQYKWDQPKFKGYIVFATNDSVMAEAKEFCNTITNFNHDKFIKDMREKFGKDVRVERVIAAKGENAITDYLAFDGPRPDDSKLRWKSFFPFQNRIIDQPEEAIDVRGAVTTDYQNVLEKEWLKELRSKYKVKVNKKVLKSIK